MKLRHLEFSGLKDQHRSLDFADITVLSGEMGSGKSTVLEAIMIASVGFIPRLGRSLDSLRPLLTAQIAKIELIDDRGFQVTRRLSQTATGGLSMDVKVFPPRNERTNRDGISRVASEWGSAPILFDLGEFLSLSADQRRKFVTNLMDAAGFTLTAEAVQAIYAAKTAGLPPDTLQQVETMWDALLRGEFQRGFTQLAVQEAMDAVVREQAALSSGAKHATQTVTDLRADLSRAPVIADPLEVVRDRLDALQQELSDADGEIARTKALQRERQKRNDRMAQIDREITMLERPQPESLLRDALGQIVEILASLQRDLEATVVAITNGRTQRQNQALICENQGQALAKLKGELSATDGVLSEPVSASECALSTNPACAITAERSARESLGARRAELSGNVAVGDTTLRQSHFTLRDTDEFLKRQDDRRTELEKKRLTLEEERRRIEAELGSEATEAARRGSTLDNLRQEKVRLSELLHDPLPDMDALQQLRTGVSGSLSDERSRLEAISKRNGLVQALNDAQIRTMLAEQRVDAIKTISQIVGSQGILGEFAKQVLHPFEEASNTAFLSRLPMGWTLRFLTSDAKGKDILDFGIERGTPARLIRWDGLSNGERLMVGSGLTLGLIALQRPTLKLLMVDDLTIVGPRDRLAFLTALRDMVRAGQLDSVIVATNDASGILGLVDNDLVVHHF